MNTVPPKSSPQTNRPGSAIVWLIVILVAVVVAVHFINKAYSLPKSENPTCSEDIQPWEEESRLLKPGQQLADSLSPDQPVIDQTIFLQATVKEAADATGLNITISPDGNVAGAYSADYNKGTDPQMNYVMNADFEGNFDPSNIYFDEQGSDPSKLFFLTKGKMFIVAHNFTADTIKYNTQDIYVTGWINPDYSATGRLVLMTGRKTFQTFHWKTVPRRRTDPFRLAP